MKNRLIIFIILVLSNIWTYGQKENKVQFPNVPGFLTLKGDFHMHTVFSDGHVWPSMRVFEAARDGLDIISITDHIDFEGYPDDLKRDRNRGFEIAENKGKELGVLVIKGVEISPRVSPYHNNAIFVQDANSFPFEYMKQTHSKFVMKDSINRAQLLAPFLEAQRQKAFVFYNHPTYRWWDKNEKELFTSFHKELVSKGILGGVEVVNGARYNVIAHRFAEEYNLTMFGNSDAHEDVSYPGTHRPMTLVFAKEKSEESIKEAIINGRTAVYSDNFLIGRKPEVEALFKASLEITTLRKTGIKTDQLLINIFNNSDIPYEVKLTTEYVIDYLPLGKIILKPHETTSILLNPIWEFPAVLKLFMHVDNILISSDKSLETTLYVSL